MPEATARALGIIIFVYGVIIGAAYFFGDSWLGWVLCLPILGALQNYLFLLHHEGAHGLLHPKRAVNDFLANVFCGYPFFESLTAYRKFHLSHHRQVCDGARDPEIPFYRAQGYHYRPLRFPEKVRLTALDLCGYHWLQFFISFLLHQRKVSEGSFFSRRDAASIFIFGAMVILVLVAGFGGAWVWFWLVPQITVAFHLAKLRGYREHGARGGRLEEFTKDLSVNPLERFFLFPLRAHLHLAHHRNPRREWFRQEA